MENGPWNEIGRRDRDEKSVEELKQAIKKLGTPLEATEPIAGQAQESPQPAGAAETEDSDWKLSPKQRAAFRGEIPESEGGIAAAREALQQSGQPKPLESVDNPEAGLDPGRPFD